MEDVIVTMLDGTKVAKSEVPEGVVYINENGLKVKKVKKVVAATPQHSAAKSSSIFDSLKDMVGQKLPNILSSVNLDEGIAKIKGLKGIDTKSLVDILQNLKGSGKSGASGISNLLSGAAGGIDVSKLRGATSSLNMPWLNKILDSVEGMNPAASAKQQLQGYLSVAMDDGVITDEELAQLRQHAKAAGVSDAELQTMLKNCK